MIPKRHEPKSPSNLSGGEKIKTVVKTIIDNIQNIKNIVDGGRVLMAITNTLMMVQAGFPTGVCVVRSCEGNH